MMINLKLFSMKPPKMKLSLKKLKSTQFGQDIGVKFSLFTHRNRQYIAYYNSNRNMVVGQRDLTSNKFDLHVMPSPPRDKKLKYKEKDSPLPRLVGIHIIQLPWQ